MNLLLNPYLKVFYAVSVFTEKKHMSLLKECGGLFVSWKTQQMGDAGGGALHNTSVPLV